MHRPPHTSNQFFTCAMTALSLSLAACSGGDGGSAPAPGTQLQPPPGAPTPPGSPPPPAASPPPATVNAIATEDDAADFMTKAGLGGTEAEITGLVGRNKTDWLRAEFAKMPTPILPIINARAARGETVNRDDHSTLFWEMLIENDDQLRMRMVFALSQILVVSDSANNDDPRSTAYFVDILANNAFGNYRDLLQDVTYAPIMARYLTYLNNLKGDPRTGRMPDENYAREIMQLFTIGLVELNMDGTVRTGADGNPIETYDNDDVVGLARVFTGLGGRLDGSNSRTFDADYVPLEIRPQNHSELEKSFLGLTIPAGTSGDASIDQALDQIFAHPNLAPFISRQLLQRFTTSNPTPAQVLRVANAFETGSFSGPDGTSFGTGQRGDLEATLAAIVLDPSLDIDTPESGKIREPILRFVHWARAFDIGSIDVQNEFWLRDTSDAATRLGQHPFRSPSVFNFYRPGYVAPGTETGARNLTAPEFQLVNEATAIGFINFMERFVFDTSPESETNRNSFIATYPDEVVLADQPQALADHLDTLLTGGRMSDETKADIVSAITQLPLRGTNDAGDRLDRARLAILMAVTSPAFTILN